MGDVVFKNPFIVGSGPTVKNVEQIKMAQDSGWAGASLKLAIDPFPYLNLPPRYRWLKKEKYHIFTAEKRLTAKEALDVVEEARKVTKDFVLIPTITYDGEDYEGWGRLAKRFEDAGAHVIELNMCCPNMSFNLSNTGETTKKNTGASLGNDMENLPKAVKEVLDAVKIPVIVKFSPEGNKLAAASHVALTAGAAGVGHSGNRLGIPDIDIKNPMKSIYHLQDQITLGCMSGPWLRPLALRDTYQMRHALGKDPFIIGSGGVSNLESAVQQIMVGSDAVWICTETMIRGFDFLPKMLDGLAAYMKEMGYTKIRDFRDLLLGNIKSAGDLTIRQGHAFIDKEVCTRCGLCWKIGHCCAISHDADGVTVVDPEKCLACATCIDICPSRAISMKETK
jgi:dihydroorotate dehydrogenase/Pyruvate/2-oxoacid:ferredoxin oxidoreductase delta subunit